MGNEKRPPQPDGVDDSKTTDEKGDKPAEAARPPAIPVVDDSRVRSRNGAGRGKTLGRKIKDYLN